MGSLAKRIGQWSAKSLETESANIFKSIKANKVHGSLSMALDQTLKNGHNMKVFGLGTLASMKNLDQYKKFTSSMYLIYSTMEDELDKACTMSEPIAHVWTKHKFILKRSDKLYSDLQDVTTTITTTNDENELNELIRTPSNATKTYMSAIHEASKFDQENHHATLLGHVYCRYFADLFGGQMLQAPYQFALNLQHETPRHYVFDFEQYMRQPGGRRKYIETLYEDINVAAEMFLMESQHDIIVKETMDVFKHNINVYNEQGPLVQNAVFGSFNAFVGYLQKYQK